MLHTPKKVTFLCISTVAVITHGVFVWVGAVVSIVCVGASVKH